MKKFLSIIVSISFSSYALAYTSLRTVSESDLSGEFDELQSVHQALGIIQYQKTETKKDCTSGTCRIINEKITDRFSGQTGFFIAPDLFVTAETPDEKKLFACNGDTKTVIATGLFHARLRQFKPQYRFKECVVHEPRLGIAVIRVEGMDGNKAHHPVTLPIVPSNYTFGATKLFSALGFSFEGRLFYSDQCRPEHVDYSIPKGQQAKYPSIKLEKGAWSKLECLYRIGMAGSPILVRDGGQLVAAGIVSTLTEQKGEVGESGAFMYDLLAFPKLASIQARLGMQLFGGEETQK